MRTEQRLVHGLAPEQIDDLLAELAALVEPMELHFLWRPQVDDPGDEMVLEAAINGDADALVTYNVSDFIVAAERFGVSVLRPIDALKRM
jgi:predicted nucleic acid-binding protein